LKTNTPDELSAKSNQSVWRRFSALWRLKLGATAIISVVFWSFYLFLSRHPFFPVHALPFTSLDNWAGFRPNPWAWVYESNFLLTGIAPWLLVSREQLRRFIIGFAWLSAISFFIFAIFPVASPRPTEQAIKASSFLFLITRLDGPLNAFPSLHASCLVYNLALIRHLFGPKLHPGVMTGLYLWAGMILFATLATKQHYAIDLLAGGLLGWVVDWFVWRSSTENENASAKIRRTKEATSQAG
jgi:membrane-associated phospholipid phosphatase